MEEIRQGYPFNHRRSEVYESQRVPFPVKNRSVAKKIDFVPFDYTKAGVYGSEEWKKLADFDPDLAGKFDKRITGM